MTDRAGRTPLHYAELGNELALLWTESARILIAMFGDLEDRLRQEAADEVCCKYDRGILGWLADGESHAAVQ